MLRDELQAIDDPSAVRLATQIDLAATMLPPLLDVSRKLEYVPGGSFAKLQHELSGK